MKTTPLPFLPVLETAHTSAEITDAKGRLIASFAVRPYRNRTNADVRLMASAPALLAALQSVCDDASHALGTEADPQDRLSVARQDLAAILESARAAIALAEGREA